MALSKPKKPRWADGSSSYISEPTEQKKNLGWVFQEQPPFQWMNWLFNKIKSWVDFGEKFLDIDQSLIVRSGSSITWSGTQLTFSSDIELIFKVGGDVYTNKIASADSPLSLSDGDVLVLIKNNSDITLASVAYGSIEAGKYSIVAESSLAENTDEHEVILLRRRGSDLEIPLLRKILEENTILVLGGSAPNPAFVDGTHGGYLTGMKSMTNEFTIAVGTGIAPGLQLTWSVPGDTLIFGATIRVTQEPSGGLPTFFSIGVSADKTKFLNSVSSALGTTQTTPKNYLKQMPHSNPTTGNVIWYEGDANVAGSDLKFRLTLYYMEFVPPTS